jgi:hypothetical protein
MYARAFVSANTKQTVFLASITKSLRAARRCNSSATWREDRVTVDEEKMDVVTFLSDRCAWSNALNTSAFTAKPRVACSCRGWLPSEQTEKKVPAQQTKLGTPTCMKGLPAAAWRTNTSTKHCTSTSDTSSSEKGAADLCGCDGDTLSDRQLSTSYLECKKNRREERSKPAAPSTRKQSTSYHECKKNRREKRSKPTAPSTRKQTSSFACTHDPRPTNKT